MNKVLLQTLSALAFILAPTFAHAQSSQSYLSPDGALQVRIADISRRCVESRIEVRQTRGALLLRKSYASPDCEHGMGVHRGAWTPDSKFFVFNAQMLGGHQPWHWPVYFYSRSENRIRNLDDYVGPVVAPEFKIEAPHSAETRVFEMGSEEGRRVTADLSRIGRRKHQWPEPHNGMQRTRRKRASYPQSSVRAADAGRWASYRDEVNIKGDKVLNFSVLIVPELKRKESVCVNYLLQHCCSVSGWFQSA